MKAYVDENKKRGKYKCVERERVQKRGGKVVSKRKRTIVKKYTRKKYPEEDGHDEKRQNIHPLKVMS